MTLLFYDGEHRLFKITPEYKIRNIGISAADAFRIVKVKVPDLTRDELLIVWLADDFLSDYWVPYGVDFERVKRYCQIRALYEQANRIEIITPTLIPVKHGTKSRKEKRKAK